MRTLALTFTLLFTATLTAAEPLNVIVILADDLGISDLGCYGNTYHETPHLNQLAKDGCRFTNGYSACTVCSPTRAALLSGQYPARLHVTDWIAGHVRPFAKLKVPEWTKQLPTGTFTIAQSFKQAGYTTASIGKWHLGNEDNYPEKFGFDVNIAGTFKGQPPSYFSPYQIPTLKDGPKGEFLSDRLGKEACQWIGRNKDKPFFLYLPHFAVHTPLMGKPEIVEKYKKKNAKLNATYAALVESMDDTVGMIRAQLKEVKIDHKTVVIFTSDNGGLLGGKNIITTNPPYRAGKGSAYEGGVRVPWIVYWPGQTTAGSTSNEVIHSIDLLPTLAAGLNLKVQADSTIDGTDFTLALRGKTLPVRPVYWHYPHYHPGGATPYSAIRDGDYKLFEFFEDNHVELYNLQADVAEKTDLAKAEPDMVKKLSAKLNDWRKSVKAQLPTANPQYDPAKEPQGPNKK